MLYIFVESPALGTITLSQFNKTAPPLLPCQGLIFEAGRARIASGDLQTMRERALSFPRPVTVPSKYS